MLSNSKGNSFKFICIFLFKFFILIFVSIDDKNETNLLTQSLDNLRRILTSIDESVAFYQLSNEFRKIYEKIDPKSETIVNICKTFKIEKSELIDSRMPVILTQNIFYKLVL